MEPLVVGFDLDLTLVDSRPGIAAVYREIGVRTGVAIDADAAVTRLGPPLEVELELWYPPHRVPEMVALFRRIYPEYAVTASPVLPGAAEAVAAVRRHAGAVIVITGKYELNARRHLHHIGLTVDAVVGWAWAETKTAAMLDHGVGMYLGDHPADMAAAAGAGALAIGITTGDHTSHDLSAAGADTVLTSLGEFPAWLDAHILDLDGGISVGLPVADR
jgi:phosphoglycolate phosphatase-like HAD superfamily hydrolase